MNEEKIIEIAISAFIKEVLKDSKSFLKEVWDEGKFFIENNLKNYLSEKYKKYNTIKTVLKGSTPVSFYDIYYHLNLISKNRASQRKIIKTNYINSTFKYSNNITIIGDAGSGKSTLVKHLFIQSIKEKKHIPILIELRYIETKDTSFFDYLKNIITDSNITKNSRIIDRLLKQGKFIFFLDGFDEVSSINEASIIEGIDNFSSKYKTNKFILTTRPHSNALSIPSFTNYQIAPLSLNDGDIHSFIDLQLKEEEELAEKIKESVSEGSKKYIHSFLTNPLLLSLYILTYQSNAEIPDKKYIFYRRVINSLYSEHDSKSKLGYVREKRTNLTQVEFEKVLKSFCFLAYFDEKFSFDFDYVTELMMKIKSSNKDLIFDIRDFIYDMKVSVSLWTDDSGVLSFAHRSLQEYFSALFIKDLVDSNKEIVYEKLLLHCENAKSRNETENFLSLCEEMDAVYFYKYYYLPLTKELYSSICIGDTKNKLRNYVLFFCEGVHVPRKIDKPLKRARREIMINQHVYKSIYIHIDHTIELNKELRSVVPTSTNKYQTEEPKRLLFKDTEGLLDLVVEELMKKRGVKLINSFSKYLEAQIKEKELYIENTIKTDIEIINMI